MLICADVNEMIRLVPARATRCRQGGTIATLHKTMTGGCFILWAVPEIVVFCSLPRFRNASLARAVSLALLGKKNTASASCAISPDRSLQSGFVHKVPL